MTGLPPAQTESNPNSSARRACLTSPPSSCLPSTAWSRLGSRYPTSSLAYTAQAHIAGGRNGRGRTADGKLDLDLRQPKELGGDGAGANPEQLFAIGYAACFGATLALVGQRDKLKADDAEIDSSVSLIPRDDGRLTLEVELRISLPSITKAQAAELVTAAHQVCPYSNATRDNIDVALVVNGTQL